MTGAPIAPGPLALVGGDEFRPGNEAPDRILVEAAQARGVDRPAFVIVSAVVRHDPDRAVATAQGWFAGLGLAVDELPIRTRRQARDDAIVELSRSGAFFYLAGGDPGIIVELLRDSPVWAAIVDAWRDGAALAGSSAGAMAFGSWTLLRARVPGDAARQARKALGLVPGIAVAPHFGSFGRAWVPSARSFLVGSGAVAGRGGVLLGLDERTAAVWRGGRWSAVGEGGVTLIDGDAERRIVSGEAIDGLPQPDLGPGREARPAAPIS